MFHKVVALGLLAYLAAASPVDKRSPQVIADPNISASPTSLSPAPMPTALAQISRGYECATAVGGPNVGSPVIMTACLTQTSPGIGSQLFAYNAGGLLRFGASDLCLDAGENPSNGVSMKLWTCYEGLGQQTWIKDTPSGYGRIKTVNNQCLNVDNGNPNKLQTWECSNNGDPQEQFQITYSGVYNVAEASGAGDVATATGGGIVTATQSGVVTATGGDIVVANNLLGAPVNKIATPSGGEVVTATRGDVVTATTIPTGVAGESHGTPA